MSKRSVKKQRYKEEIAKEADYYRLKTQAVEDLATADESNSPPVSEEELRAYTSGHKLNIPSNVKLLFIKGWFAGAVCFFFIWGLGGRLGDQLDLLVVTGLALGMVTDLLTNNVLRFFERTPGENSRYMMVPKKGFISFPLNILYAFVVLGLVYTLYNVINLVIVTVTGAVDTVPLGVEPILFGLFYLGFDQLLIELKRLVLRHLPGAAQKPAP